MIIKHLYRHRKLFVTAVIVAGITYIVSNLHFGNHIDPEQVHQTYTGLAHIQDSQVIDKDMILKSLSKVQEMVGSSGTSTKTYIYTDSVFAHHNWLSDSIGQRSLEITAEAFFKTGVDLGKISDHDIVSYGTSLFVKLPKSELLSLDVPFDHLVFKSKIGLIRSDLSLQEKRYLYTEIRKIITNNIMNDQTIQNNTYDGVKSAIENLLHKVPNVGKIVFSQKME